MKLVVKEVVSSGKTGVVYAGWGGRPLSFSCKPIHRKVMFIEPITESSIVEYWISNWVR